uniref:Very-long-chain (3R)-3-hydroxyacyl-CoA dehydratase n=1 Tax=Corvus moneduloides TaxID=1196302 RepID=A0A8C3H053_CORMO
PAAGGVPAGRGRAAAPREPLTHILIEGVGGEKRHCGAGGAGRPPLPAARRQRRRDRAALGGETEQPSAAAAAAAAAPPPAPGSSAASSSQRRGAASRAARREPGPGPFRGSPGSDTRARPATPDRHLSAGTDTRGRGIVRTSVLVTGVQVSSRIFMVWFIAHSIKQIQNEESVILFLVVWTVTEITRYSFYTFNLLNHLPYFIKWARYNFFIILYPAGVAGELLTIYAALPYVKKTGMFSLRLPNKYNVSFDYYYFLIIVMFSYVPLFPQLYFHMLRQRRRVLHGEVIVEKDD